MRLTRAIDRFLEQMRLEKDWTPRTVDSVYRTLAKLADNHADAAVHDFDGRAGKELVRDHLGRQYGRASSSTRATRISYFHSFFAWAEDEGLIDDDRVREIRRPPKRRPDIYRPAHAELRLVLAAATQLELPPLLLLVGLGLRASELVALRWRDVDLLRGRVRVQRKGGHWQSLPIDPLILLELRVLYAQWLPGDDDHVFVAETEQWVGHERRVRRVIDPSTPRTTKALWAMVRRVSKRAGVRPLGPHALRHGFANEFLRATRAEFGTADLHTLKYLMGHSRLDTTEQYLKELEAEEAAEVLRRLRADELSQTVEDPGVAFDPASGGGGNRTRVRTGQSDQPGGTESEDDGEPHERSLTGQQPPQEGGVDG